MIAALRGRIARWDGESSTLWLDVGGVTYELIVPAFAAGWLAQHEVGDELHLYTYYHVSERNPKPVIIGFPRLAEREFFRKFIEVPEVGPTKAVRARLAQTIVAKLHGRVLQEALLRDELEAADGAPSPSDIRADAVDALVTLQYGRRDAEREVDGVLLSRPELESLEELLRMVLEQQAPAG